MHELLRARYGQVPEARTHDRDGYGTCAGAPGARTAQHVPGLRPSAETNDLRDADPADKAELYAQLGLRMTYRPQKRLVEAPVTPSLHMCKGFVSEGGLEPGNR